MPTKYLVIIGEGSREEKHWLPIVEAGRLLDSGMVSVRIGGVALDEGSSKERSITDAEKTRMHSIADEWSALA